MKDINRSVEAKTARLQQNLTEKIGGEDVKARKKFVAPRLKSHNTLPVVTAGSVNLW